MVIDRRIGEANETKQAVDRRMTERGGGACRRAMIGRRRHHVLADIPACEKKTVCVPAAIVSFGAGVAFLAIFIPS